MSKDTKTLRIICSRCGVATQADVWSYYHWTDGGTPKKPSETYFVVCTGCDEPSLVEIYQDRSKLLENLTVEKATKGEIGNGWEWKKQFPIENIPDTPKHVPDIVNALYIEACSCLLNGFPNAAGAMFRKTLEAATRTDQIRNQIPDEHTQEYDNSTLWKRLESIQKQKIIPESLYELGQTIRREGNEATHEIESYTVSEAQNLKGFVDTFLNFVFTIPHQMQHVRTALSRSAASEKS